LQRNVHTRTQGRRNETARFIGEHGVVAATLGALACSPASAKVIYDGGGPDQASTLYAQSPGAEAMSFILSAGSSIITDAHWWGGCYSPIVHGNTCSGSSAFTLTIWTDSGSGPGLLEATRDVGGANQFDTGKVIGPSGPPQWEEYSYSAAFAPITTLVAGTRYYLVIQETFEEPVGVWGVETTSNAPMGSTTYSSGLISPVGEWALQSQKLAFNLTSTVPEPTTWAMLLLGFAALGFAGYRQAPKRAATA
jgi:hypothetical protein